MIINSQTSTIQFCQILTFCHIYITSFFNPQTTKLGYNLYVLKFIIFNVDSVKYFENCMQSCNHHNHNTEQLCHSPKLPCPPLYSVFLPTCSPLNLPVCFLSLLVLHFPECHKNGVVHMESYSSMQSLSLASLTQYNACETHLCCIYQFLLLYC